MLSELMSMGTMLTFYTGVSAEIQRKVAAHFGMPDELLLSWLRSLYAARNICAHHSRFWNRTLGYPPSSPNKNKFPDWHQKTDEGKPVFTYNRCGIILMICRRMLHLISPSSRWHERLELLFAEYHEIPVEDMGLPGDWQRKALGKPGTV